MGDFCRPSLGDNTPPKGTVLILGDVAQNQVLTIKNTLFDSDGLGSFSYQWLADNTNILGASTNSYTLKQSDVGKKISLVINYIDGMGKAELVTSESTGNVIDVNDSPVLNYPIDDYRVTENKSLNITLAADCFTDLEDAALNYSVKLSDGSVLPSWIQFNSTNLTFSINPGESVVGLTAQTFSIELTASDSGGLKVTDNFDLLVRPLGSGYDIAANVRFWKANSIGNFTKLGGVSLTLGSEFATSTDQTGISLNNVEDTQGLDDGFMTLTPQANISNNAKSAITLSDVLATLKLYLNKPLPDAYASPLNYIAADFDGSGAVTLTDVLQLLKYYLNKSTTVTPNWQFVDAADFSADGKTFAGANGANLARDNTTPHVIDQTFDATHTSIELIGVLRGDIDGSWVA